MDGGSTFLYLILADGSAHEVGNMGNTYLVIDGDYFEADYSWLSSWDSIIPEGGGAAAGGESGQAADPG